MVKPSTNIEEKLDKFYLTFEQLSYFQTVNKSKKVILFLSMGCQNERADVLNVYQPSFKEAWKQAKKNAMKHADKSNRNYEWIKIDVVEKEEILTIEEFIQLISSTKKNYFRKGVSFDEHYQFSFLEQELNGNAIIQVDSQKKRGFIQQRNMQHYIKKHRPFLSKVTFLNRVKEVRIFNTRSFFYDEKGKLVTLKQTDLDNGRRNEELDQKQVKELITKSSTFLADQVQHNGKFTYGYFSCFDKEIHFYNILRHASTLYAMAEAYELFPNEDLKKAIQRGLSYLKDKGSRTYYKNGQELAYLIDGETPEKEEIKLGANAAAILALTKYQEVFDDKTYLPFAMMLGDGILQMQDHTGRFDHVLYTHSLELKERFRIVYYDGEAAFALMRLYAVNSDEKWITSVEKAFSYFIEKNHWRHHDHWLSYCTNELTKYRPKREYFIFGLKNVSNKLSFIYQRHTTYPTFLELTLAGWNMTKRMEVKGFSDLLSDGIQERIEQTIHKRADYQRNGFFYPETAMYFKNPKRILGSFFIRHHSFRSRIDDSEHYLSGYCAYYKFLTGVES